MRHYSAAPDTFAKIVKMTNHMKLWDAKIDILWVLLITFAFMAWSTALESTLLDQPNFAWLLRFLQSEQNFFNHLVTVWWSTAPLPFMQQMFLLASVVLWPNSNSNVSSKLDYDVCSSVRLSNQTTSEAMHKISEHQLRQYYQPQ